MENEKSTGNKYTVKDAAIIGIFCAVMFVVFMVYSTLTGASLFYSMIFNAAGAALILAPFYVYMCMKVGKHGPALVYNIMWAIIAGLMMGPFMIPWFLGGGIIAELSMCGKGAYHDIKRVSISWVITALVLHTGCPKSGSSRTHSSPPASVSSRFRFRPSITLIRSMLF